MIKTSFLALLTMFMIGCTTTNQHYISFSETIDVTPEKLLMPGVSNDVTRAKAVLFSSISSKLLGTPPSFAAIFLDVTAQEAIQFRAVNKGRNAPRIDIGLANYEFSKKRGVRDKITGKSACVISARIYKKEGDGITSFLLDTFYGSQGGASYIFKLKEENGKWVIVSERKWSVI